MFLVPAHRHRFDSLVANSTPNRPKLQALWGGVEFTPSLVWEEAWNDRVH